MLRARFYRSCFRSRVDRSFVIFLSAEDDASHTRLRICLLGPRLCIEMLLKVTDIAVHDAESRWRINLDLLIKVMCCSLIDHVGHPFCKDKEEHDPERCCNHQAILVLSMSIIADTDCSCIPLDMMLADETMQAR